jgi:hypothetical protein
MVTYIASSTSADLKKTLKKHGDQKDSVLPLEMSYLNKNAFISVVGHQPQVIFKKLIFFVP